MSTKVGFEMGWFGGFEGAGGVVECRVCCCRTLHKHVDLKTGGVRILARIEEPPKNVELEVARERERNMARKRSWLE